MERGNSQEKRNISFQVNQREEPSREHCEDTKSETKNKNSELNYCATNYGAATISKLKLVLINLKFNK